MNQSDFKTFAEAFETAWSFHRQIDSKTISMAFDLLKHQSLANVLGGLRAHCQDPVKGQFGPKPADILYQIERRMPQRVGADEAWTMLPRSESDTVVWTDEMAEAYGISKHEHEGTASRMAFRAAYDRICERNKLSKIQPKWIVSIGWGDSRKAEVLREAIKLGRITEADIDPSWLEEESVGIAGLIENHAVFDPEKAKENLGQLRKLLK